MARKASAQRGRRARAIVIAFYATCLAGMVMWAMGCNGWDPRRPFERDSPEVDQALHNLDGGKPESAESVLEQYLEVGQCNGDAGFSMPEAVRKKYNGSYDLGLTLFYLAERFGVHFGDEEKFDGGRDARLDELRSTEIDCVLPLLNAIANDPDVPLELRARAFYLAGNLEFMRRHYEDAVKDYDKALALIPGLKEEAGGDAIGRDAANNRAIALRRMYTIVEGGIGDGDGDVLVDAPSQGNGDSGDSGNGGQDSGDSGDNPDGNTDGGEGPGKRDAGKDAGKDAGDKKQNEEDAGQPQPIEPDPNKDDQQPLLQEDDRILDQFDKRPTYQREEAKQQQRAHGLRRERVDK